MRLEITGRHLTVTAAARSFAAKRIAHTIRNLNNSAVSAQLVLTKERGRIKAEVTLHVKPEHFLHGAGTGTDLQAAITAAVDKIERQIEKLKGKWSGRRRRGEPTERVSAVDGAAREAAAAAPGAASLNGRRIIRARRYAV